MRRLLILLLLTSSVHAAEITVAVDASDARRSIFHSHVTLPAGTTAFVYPKWIPGEHAPTGPLMQVVGLHVRSGGQEIAWTRDPVEMFTIRVMGGGQPIDVDFDYLSPSTTFGLAGYGESANATLNLLMLPWNHVVVYPAATSSDSVTVRASVKLPAGWQFDTALPIARRDGDRIEFEPVSLTTFIDSPLMAGAFVRMIPIADDGREHVTLVADSQQALALSDERIQQMRNLVAETDILFGARHYRTYRWLVGLSDILETQGLEHHESSDNRAPERAYIDPTLVARHITTLSHEFVHSWNGKYRRPAGLATPEYQSPMIGELLWVYEGMTRYLGNFVLTGRSGMFTAEQDREYAAYVAGNLERNRPGRNWRPLVDTAIAVQTLSAAPAEDVPYRRALDYYDESLLVWLDTDMTIRAKSGGTKSLDDFCRLFFGPPGGAPTVKPYTLDDVVSTLNRVVANDWRTFLTDRVYRVTAHPPLASLEASGWRLIFNDTPNWYHDLREKTDKNVNASYSIGVWVKDDGTVSEVVHDSPAFVGGLTPGMKINSVNGRKFSGDVLHEELKARRPLQFAVERGSATTNVTVDYRGGEQYPHLQRIEGKPDLLNDVIRPHR